jgi:predicted RNase H-like nuclease (RuvC/YqgF family)
MSEKRGTDGDRAVLANDIHQYQRSLMMKDQTINDLKMSISQLDSNLDEMQNELDTKTEELVATKQRLEKQVLEFSNFQHQMSISNGKEDNLNRKLYERE